MNTISVKSRQSVFDVAIQACGSVEGAIELAMLNGWSLTEELEAGAVVMVGKEINSKVKRFYDYNEICPATSISTADVIREDGIEYWAIENDFIVN